MSRLMLGSGRLRLVIAFLKAYEFRRLLSVLERRTCPQGLLCSARQNQLVIDQFKLRDRNGDIMLRQAKKAAGADDGVGDRLVGRDDDVVDRSDAFIFIVEYRLPEDCGRGAPTQGDVPQLRGGDADNGRSRHL